MPRPASPSAVRARPTYWLMLALAIGASGGLRVLASRAQASQDWQPAVYRYPADGMPDCTSFDGRAPFTALQRDRWFRMVLPDAPRRSPQGCLLREQLRV